MRKATASEANLKLARVLLLFSVIVSFRGHASVDESSASKGPLTPTEIAPLDPPAESGKWRISPTISVPFRWFEIQTGAKNAQTQDPMDSISYNTSATLEGAIFLGYKDFGFTYRHTLASASLGEYSNEASSKNEEFRVAFFLNRQLFEFSSQRLAGLETEIATNGIDAKRKIGRPDMTYTDVHLRWMYGLPFGASRPNSLSNFYSSAEITNESRLSVDWLLGAEIMRQKISASSPFIPEERQGAYGTASTLSEVSSTGMGVSTGIGFTALMEGKSYFSIAGLVGGNYNVSEAKFANGSNDVSGFGAFMSARMSVQFVFGSDYSQNLAFKLFADSWMIPAEENNVASSDAAMSVSYGLKF